MHPSRAARAAALATGACLAAGALTALPAAAADGDPFVSEIHYDNDGTDTGEQVEVQAPAGTDLTGWSVVLYNGNGGGTYAELSLGGAVGDAGVVVVDAPGMQNGSPDGLALVDASGAAVEFLSYEGTVTATNGPAAGTTSTDIGVEETSGTPAGQSLQKVDGAWTGPTPASFGAVNSAPPPDGGDEVTCETAATATASQVQGSGDTTPMQGEEVTLKGVVVGDNVDGLGTFHLQDPAADGDPATSDAVVVFARDAEVDLGDVVVVRGTATEYNGLTEISPAEVAEDCGTAALPEPAGLELPADDAQREALEGMLVRPTGELTVTEVYDLNRYGEVLLSVGGRLMTPTEVVEPGVAAVQMAEANAERAIVLDDAVSTNLSSAGEAPPFLTVDDPVRVGDRVEQLDPVVLSYGFGAWRLQPADGTAEGTTFAASNPRTESPEDVGGDLRVASFNVLNYFVTFGGEARGADDEEGLARQQAKIVSAITALDADVIALQEIENSAVTTPETPYRALETLVAALNEVDGAGTWDYVRAHETSDVISNAIIYRTDVVKTVGAPVVPVEDEVWDNAREPIAQTFKYRGERFTVVANHLKSKGSGDGANEDQGDGQGASNPDRVAQAQALVDLVDGLDTQDVILLGDFNSYAKEDPVDVIRGAGFTDLVPALTDETTYVFDGQSGSLDHAFASGSLRRKVTGVDVWSINAVESYGYQYDGFPGLYAPYPFRASDHDPVVVGLQLKH